MRITFWGVRGSIAAAGGATVQVGGNTTCVEVQCGDVRLIFDAGTGIRVLGRHLMKELPLRAHVLFTHTHWDHIQGLPFFGPAFVPGGVLDLYGAARPGPTLREVLATQMTQPFFPVTLDAFGAELRFHEVEPRRPIHIGDATVTAAALNHPDGVVAYRVDWRGASVVFATDTEHYSVVDPRLTRLARGVDVLIHDAQYTAEEYSGASGMPRLGWGHSTVEAAVAQAKASGVARLVLFHHDPDRDDAGVADLEARARAGFPATDAAREGMVIELGEASRAAA